MSTTQRMQSPALKHNEPIRSRVRFTSAYVHVVETSLNLLEFARVRDIFINFDFSSKIIYRSFSHTMLGTDDEDADRQRELEAQIFL